MFFVLLFSNFGAVKFIFQWNLLVIQNLHEYLKNSKNFLVILYIMLMQFADKTYYTVAYCN